MGRNLSMPSVVRFVGRKLDEVKVGSIAKRHIILKPNEVFSSTKSLMKSEDWKDDPFMRDKFNIETEQLSPVDIAAKILEELRGYQFADVQGQGFIPVYTKTKLTDKLHEISGFSTDFEFLTKSKMREIQKKSKGK